MGDIVNLKGEIDRRAADKVLQELLKLARLCGDDASAVKLRYERAITLVRGLAEIKLTVRPDVTLPADLRPDQLEKVKAAVVLATTQGVLAAREEAISLIVAAIPEICTSVLLRQQ
jgi:RecJ-like exonuclease